MPNPKAQKEKEARAIEMRDGEASVFHSGKLAVTLSDAQWTKLKRISAHQKKSVEECVRMWIDGYNLDGPPWWGADLNRKRPPEAP